MSKTHSLALALVTLLAAHATQAQSLSVELNACRQMTDSARRLACYDALTLPADAPAAAPAAPTAVPVAAIDPVAKFGQESVKAPAGAPPELKQIESRIRGQFHGWHAGSQLEFENGQVWRIADGSEANYELRDPKVTVHRGVLGAFYLEIEGVGFQMRVTRVR